MMKLFSLISFVSAVSALDFDIEDAKNRPVSKVINLLKDMQKQLEKDQEADEEIYEKLACWCKINNKEKSQAIKEQQAKIEQLTVLIEEGVASTSRLSTEIENLKKEVAENQASLDKAVALREKQLEEFHSEEKDLLGSVSALKNAIVVLSKHNKSFLQSDKEQKKQILLSIKSIYENNKDSLLEKLSPSDNLKLKAFIEQATKQPTVAKYNNQSGEIFGILKNMKETFEENLATAQENEKQNKLAFDELSQAKTNEINAGQSQVDQKTTELADTKERTATARQDLEDTQNSLSADDEFLLMVKEKCQTTDEEWQERSKTRQEEILAVSTAIGVLSDDDAHDTFSKTFNFIQVRITKAVVDQQRASASKVVNNVMKKVKDPKLAMVVSSIKLDAFTKVKQAIDDMITQLKAEKAEEIRHRDFCVDELNTNEKDQASLSRQHDSLIAKVDEIKAEISAAKTAIKEIETQNSEMQVQLKRAGEDREQQNAEFQETLADQRVTKKLLTQALTVLKGFYEKKTAFIQMKVTTKRIHAHKQGPILEEPEETDPIKKLENMKGAAAPGGFKAYKKNEGATSILGLLQQIIHDTEMMEAEISNAEQQSQKTYEDMVKETNKSITTNQEALVNQNQSIARSEQELMDTESDLKDTATQLDQEANEAADLHANCDFVLKNFEIRQTARDEEVDALQQAKAILSGANFDF